MIAKRMQGKYPLQPLFKRSTPSDSAFGGPTSPVRTGEDLV